MEANRKASGQDVAMSLEEVTEGLADLTHDELRAAADYLVTSQTGIEQLVRLSKLSALVVNRRDSPAYWEDIRESVQHMAYHY